jgi:hypothetical protein
MKRRLSPEVLNALVIGFMIGIVIYSVAVNSVGFLTLIPLYIAYRLLKGSDKPDTRD